MIYFTSDLHFGSSNIIRYCARPFKSGEHMNERLVAEINNRCKEGDVLYHVGDFILYGKERGVESMRVKPCEFENQINCKVVHIEGNHDANNGLKSSILGCYIQIAKNIKAWVQHYPPWHCNHIAPKDADLYVCGHVHDKWKLGFYDGKPTVNVGCDIWNYRPVSKKELIKLYTRTINEKREDG